MTHGSGDEHNCIKNGQEVGDKLKDMGIEFVFQSHTHTCEITHSDNTVFEIGCGSLSQELKDIPLIYNQFSVGGIRDGKIVSIERWVKVNDGVSGFTYESLYPEQKNFADPDTINKKEYSDVLRPHIERLVTQAINDNINNCDAAKPLANVLGENGRIFLIDDAGAGKTIEMLKLAHDLYRTPYFPAYFSLRDYTGNEIKDLIPEEYCGLNPNRLVIILDGYDEIQEKYRNDFRGKLNTYLSKNCSVRVVLSSRKNFCKVAENGEIRTIDGFVGYKFAQISDADIRKYLIESGIDPQSFYKAVESARVEKMIFTPFYLDGLAKIFLNQNHLPSKNMVMDEIISQRFENDDDKFININHVNEKKLELFCCLEKLAFAIQLMGTTQITDLEYQDLTPPDWRNLIKMSGLSSQVSGAWLFTHNILREYLAAKCLVKMPFDKILEYCCFENSIKPSWLNTFGFVMGLSKDDRLKEWTVNNASEAIVKYGPDNFEKSRHFEIFIHVFEEYERSYISSFEGLCSENELAEYACCIKGIKYLIEKISSPVNNYSLYNALRIMQHLPRNCGKRTDMRDCLLNFCNGYYGSESYNYRCAIHAICNQNLCDPNMTKQLMNIFGTSDNDFIRAGIYEYLAYTKEQDTYVDYFLGGIQFIKYRFNSHDNRIGNESWALIEGLSAMSTAKSISKVLIRLCDEGNSNFYKSDKVFVKLVSKCSELYKEGHCDLFDILYECWIKVAMHSRYNELDAVLDFFRTTDTYSQVVLRFLGSDTPQGFYIGCVVMSYPEIMGTMEQLYKEDKLPDRSVFSKAPPHKSHRLENVNE